MKRRYELVIPMLGSYSFWAESWDEAVDFVANEILKETDETDRKKTRQDHEDDLVDNWRKDCA